MSVKGKAVRGKAMSMRLRYLVPAAAAGLLLAAAGPALAARVISTTVTGQVTAVSGGDSVTIDGRTYQVAAGSPAASAISQVQPGEQVDVTLDGPPTAAGSHVIGIAPHQGN